jgi:polyphosphate kinase
LGEQLSQTPGRGSTTSAEWASARVAAQANPARASAQEIPVDAPLAYFGRELSWLAFAKRVLAQVEDPTIPLLERVKFAGIMGMLHDEFFMKRVGGLKRHLKRGDPERSADGRTAVEQLDACRVEILDQMRAIEEVIGREIRPALEQAGIPILDVVDLSPGQKLRLRDTFAASILPVLTPLAVDAEHPFPFISNQGLNLAIQIFAPGQASPRFVRIKVPTNRPRWIPLEEGGFVPLEQVIAANLDQLFPGSASFRAYLFRVTRGAEGESDPAADPHDLDVDLVPGSILRHVTSELKARRFAGVVRLKVGHEMPEFMREWLAQQLGVGAEDIYPTRSFLALSDLLQFKVADRDELRDHPHAPAQHPRLRLPASAPTRAIFDEIRKGDILLHHPYHSFDGSVLRFLQAAAVDPQVLAIKLTIYRTSTDSPIVKALLEAARRDKQVAVLVEITARFDEAPNMAWGVVLEKEGVHVSYGVKKLKTHVKLALVVRSEGGAIRRYAHIGSGNYHTGTARLYEDVGILTCDPAVCDDIGALFNQLTGAAPPFDPKRLILAPVSMRERFTELIRREAEHARAGRTSGIRAKMNQLQDGAIIRELYLAGRDGVPITLNVRGLCCLRPGVPGLSENIRVFSVVGRFLEHSRIFEFANGGAPEYFIGSSDWMKRNLDRRVESIVPVSAPSLAGELARILDTYDADNTSAWDCGPGGVYVRRIPAPGEQSRATQRVFIELAESN